MRALLAVDSSIGGLSRSRSPIERTRRSSRRALTTSRLSTINQRSLLGSPSRSWPGSKILLDLRWQAQASQRQERLQIYQAKRRTSLRQLRRQQQMGPERPLMSHRQRQEKPLTPLPQPGKRPTLRKPPLILPIRSRRLRRMLPRQKRTQHHRKSLNKWLLIRPHSRKRRAKMQLQKWVSTLKASK